MSAAAAALLALVLLATILVAAAVVRRVRRRAPLASPEGPSLALFQAAFDLARDGLFILDEGGRFLEANSAILRMLGSRKDQLLGRPFGAGPFTGEAADLGRYARKTAHVAVGSLAAARTLELGCVPLYVEGRNLTLGRARDVTERLRDEARLKQLRAAMDAASNGIFLADRAGHVTYRNAAAERWLQASHLDRVRQHLGAEDGARFELEGLSRVATVDLTPLSGVVHVGVICDVTDERRALERERVADARLHELQRLDSLGLFAGGVAHELGNLLTSMVGYAELARDAGDLEVVHRHLDTVLLGSERAAVLLRQLRQFSGHRAGAMVPLDLGELLARTESLLRSAAGEALAVSIQLPRGPCSLLGDPAQLSDLLLHMVARARRRVIGAARGACRIRAEYVAAPAERAVGPGPQARLVFEDDGASLTEVERERLFEPFAPQSKADPLSMAAVYGIVVRHGGRIDVETAAGVSRFTVLLPASAAEPPSAGVAPRRARGGLTARLAGRRCLVVDDEPGIAALACAVIERAGARVDICGSAEEALALIRPGADDYDLVLSDIVMAGASGLELAAALAAQGSRAQVVLMTGYSGVQAPAGVRVLEKPFTPGQLLEQLAGALALGASAA